MKTASLSAKRSVHPEGARPNAWHAPVSATFDSKPSAEEDAARTDAAANATAALPTAAYSDATFEVLHQALLAAQNVQVGPQLDALEAVLRRLSDHCHENATHLASIELENGGPHLELFFEAETLRANAIADAARAVSNFVRVRALGELDQRELNASWLSLWCAVAPTNNDRGQQQSPDATSENA